MKTITIGKLFIYTEIRSQAVPYILDLSKIKDVSDEEICMCVEEQFFKKKL